MLRRLLTVNLSSEVSVGEQKREKRKYKNS